MGENFGERKREQKIENGRERDQEVKRTIGQRGDFERKIDSTRRRKCGRVPNGEREH